MVIKKKIKIRINEVGTILKEERLTRAKQRPWKGALPDASSIHTQLETSHNVL